MLGGEGQGSGRPPPDKSKIPDQNIPKKTNNPPPKSQSKGQEKSTPTKLPGQGQTQRKIDFLHTPAPSRPPGSSGQYKQVMQPPTIPRQNLHINLSSLPAQARVKDQVPSPSSPTTPMSRIPRPMAIEPRADQPNVRAASPLQRQQSFTSTQRRAFSPDRSRQAEQLERLCIQSPSSAPGSDVGRSLSPPPAGQQEENDEWVTVKTKQQKKDEKPKLTYRETIRKMVLKSSKSVTSVLAQIPNWYKGKLILRNCEIPPNVPLVAPLHKVDEDTPRGQRQAIRQKCLDAHFSDCDLNKTTLADILRNYMPLCIRDFQTVYFADSIMKMDTTMKKHQLCQFISVSATGVVINHKIQAGTCIGDYCQKAIIIHKKQSQLTKNALTVYGQPELIPNFQIYPPNPSLKETKDHPIYNHTDRWIKVRDWEGIIGRCLKQAGSEFKKPNLEMRNNETLAELFARISIEAEKAKTKPPPSQSPPTPSSLSGDPPSPSGNQFDRECEMTRAGSDDEDIEVPETLPPNYEPILPYLPSAMEICQQITANLNAIDAKRTELILTTIYDILQNLRTAYEEIEVPYYDLRSMEITARLKGEKIMNADPLIRECLEFISNSKEQQKALGHIFLTLHGKRLDNLSTDQNDIVQRYLTSARYIRDSFSFRITMVSAWVNAIKNKQGLYWIHDESNFDEPLTTEIMTRGVDQLGMLINCSEMVMDQYSHLFNIVTDFVDPEYIDSVRTEISIHEMMENVYLRGIRDEYFNMIEIHPSHPFVNGLMVFKDFFKQL